MNPLFQFTVIIDELPPLVIRTLFLGILFLSIIFSLFYIANDIDVIGEED
jgi:hypothetical protein